MNRTQSPTYVKHASGAVHAYNFSDPYLQPGDERISRATYLKARPEYCRAELLKILAPGATVYCILRHKSASGMQRRISLYAIHEGEMRTLDVLAADLMGDKVHRDGGIVVNGCGMDMGFHLVCNLGACLWPQGTPEPHGRRNGAPDSAGGYALRSAWL